MDEDTRFNVTTSKGVSEDVGAAGFRVLDSGGLFFHDAEDKFLILYAAHAWSTVEPG